MSAEREAAIRELMRAAERVFELCGGEALDEHAALGPQIAAFGEIGGRARVVIELAPSHAMVAGEMVRDVPRGVERLPIFERHAAPPDAFESVLH